MRPTTHGTKSHGLSSSVHTVREGCLKKCSRRCDIWRKAKESREILGETEKIERKESGFLEEV